MSHKCTYCNSTFQSKSYLTYHQKRTQYCLKMQGDLQVKNNVFECKYCEKILSSEKRLKTHYEICSEYSIFRVENNYKEKIAELNIQLTDQKEHYEKQIKDLQDKLENIAVKAVSRPIHSTTSNKTQINNFIHQLQPVTEEKLKESVSNLTIDHIRKGPEGYAQYALDYPLKDKMICVDYSRRKVKFKDPDGNVITDPEMTGLSTKFFNSIKDKNKELVCLCANELKEKLGDDNIMDTMVKIFDYKIAVDRGSEGEKTEFHHDFVRKMCSKTIKDDNE